MLQLKWGLAALKGEVREERVHDKGGGEAATGLISTLQPGYI